MKSTITFLIIMIGYSGFSQTTYVDKRENIQLIGKSKKSDLQAEPYNEWYQKFYEEYTIDEDRVKDTDKLAAGVSVEVFMGTWCGDSKREVPRFYKVAEQMGFKESDISLVNLSAEDGEYKQCPTAEEKGLNIHRVPTFIFKKNGKEIGRIVESPITSLETDIAQILHEIPTAPRYTAVSYLNDLFEKESIDSIEANLKDHYRKTYYMVKGNKSELNTYGYVLLDQEEYEKAIIVFKINTMIFKDEANAFDSLGEAYLRSGDREKAIETYKLAMAKDVHNKYTPDILIKLMTEQ